MWLVWWNFPETEIHLWWKVWLVWWNFPKTEIHLQRKMWIVWWNFPQTEIHLCTDISQKLKYTYNEKCDKSDETKTKIHLQRKVSIVWWNFPKTKIYLQIIWKMWIVWWNFPKSETRLWLTVIWKMWLVWCANYTFPTPNGYSWPFPLVPKYTYDEKCDYDWWNCTNSVIPTLGVNIPLPKPNHSRSNWISITCSGKYENVLDMNWLTIKVMKSVTSLMKQRPKYTYDEKCD